MSALFLSALLAASTPTAAQLPPRDRDESKPIIVTGKRISNDTKAALDACLARHCPANEDIDATLAHAEALLISGKYRDARTALLGSLHRNRNQAARYPVPVSDLYRANALVADHLGLDEDYYSSTWGILRALRAGISTEDYRHFGARMEVAAMMARMRGPREAQRVYEDLAGDARKAGRTDIAAIADLRAARLSYQQVPSEDARRRIREIGQSNAADTIVAASMAKLFLAQLARQEGKTEEADALLKQVAAKGIKSPILVYSPPYQMIVQEIDASTDLTDLDGLGNPAQKYAGNFDDKWIDVGFWVQPDGRVSDLEILRKKGDESWADPLLKSIPGRLYSASAASPFYRIERYTYTSGYEGQTGTHLRQRSPRARVEYLDLTSHPDRSNG